MPSDSNKADNNTELGGLSILRDTEYIINDTGKRFQELPGNVLSNQSLESTNTKVSEADDFMLSEF